MPAPSGEQICTFIGQRLAAYKVPAQVHIQREPLPRNASGKVVKAELKAGLHEYLVGR
ncbi:hypothetical protein D9M73_247080 [compost metagenome]